MWRAPCVTLAVVAAWLASGCSGEGPAAATEDDLALAYMDFENTLAGHPPPTEQIADINRMFDEITIRFFIGPGTDVVVALRKLTATLLSGSSPSAEQDLIASLKTRVQPLTLQLDQPRPPVLQIAHMKVAGLAPRRQMALLARIRDSAGQIRGEQMVELDIRPLARAQTSVALGVSVPELSPGVYGVELGGTDGAFAPAWRWRVVLHSLDAQRLANEQDLAAVQADTPELQQALSVARARNAHLVDKPNPDDTTVFVSDPALLAGEVGSEVNALLEGHDPYVAKTGDYWRVLATDRGNVPMRVYGPAAVRSGEPLPLVIAFHGAGGNENLFFFGYGAGAITQLAEQRGFVVVTPLTEPFLGTPGLLPALIEALEFDYAIDPRRIYVLGHSLGAVVAAELAQRYGDTLAGVCCISGGSNLVPATTVPPTLLIAGELDPLGGPRLMQAAADEAQQAGLPVEFELVPNYGHTLVVNVKLAEAVDWLLMHTR